MTELEVVEVVVPELVLPGDAFGQLVDQWLLSKRSAATRRGYRIDLDQWALWCRDQGGDPLTARRAAIDSWGRSLEDRDYAPKTIARKLSAASSFYRYLVEVDVLPANPAAHITRPATDDYAATDALDESELDAVVQAAKEHGQLEYVAVLLLGTTACRSAELLRAEVKDYTIYQREPVLTVTRKGGKRQRLPLQPAVANQLDLLLDGRTTGPLIRSGNLTADYQWLLRLLTKLGEEIQLPPARQPLTPHVLRASFATIAIDGGVSLTYVQDALGHTDPRTTKLYDRGKGQLRRLRAASNAVTKHIKIEEEEAS
jgi:integrase/recombinase XerD